MADKEEQMLIKRFCELAEKSYTRSMFTFTPFLGLQEQDALWKAVRQTPHASVSLWGGREECERQMARFGDPEELGYEEEFPIVCLLVSPRQEKFAQALSHRDYLGALMNLGIERDTLGDILVQEKKAYLFCAGSIAPFIEESLNQVAHTNVVCRITDSIPAVCMEEPRREEHLVASLRIDGILSKVYGMSRNQSMELFRSGRIYVNGRSQENNSLQLRQQDKVSVRGYGRFVFEGVKGETKKGKIRVGVSVFR